jgi:hypothetical protein
MKGSYHRRMKMVVLMVVLAVAGCGPSTQEVKTAKTARYKTDGRALFDIAVAVAEQDYKIGEVDAAGLQFATQPQFYSPEGGRQSPGAGGFVNMSDRSVQLAIVVEIVKADDRFVVVVTPHTMQVISGSPKPRELAPDDPNLPGWVHGRVESLYVGIYNAAKQHAAP